MLKTFRISYTDGQGRRVEDLVEAFDADSAVHVLKCVRPEAAYVNCEGEAGEQASEGRA